MTFRYLFIVVTLVIGVVGISFEIAAHALFVLGKLPYSLHSHVLLYICIGSLFVSLLLAHLGDELADGLKPIVIVIAPYIPRWLRGDPPKDPPNV